MTQEKRALTRLVREPGGAVRPDRSARAPGRGAYLCDDPACWRRAAKQTALLARALRAPAEAVDGDELRREADALEARASSAPASAAPRETHEDAPPSPTNEGAPTAEGETR